MGTQRYLTRGKTKRAICLTDFPVLRRWNRTITIPTPTNNWCGTFPPKRLERDFPWLCDVINRRQDDLGSRGAASCDLVFL